MSDTSILSLRDAVCGYGATAVLQGLSLEVARGEVVALIGPNGHGKSTLLRMMSGLLALSAGSLRFKGREIGRDSMDRRVAAGLVHVPQGDQLFPEMTVEENLLMGAYLCTDRKVEMRRLDEVYALFPKLAQRQRQIASGLSGGERRMVGIGRGLMSGGDLMLIDEPSLGLAPLIIEQIYEALGLLARSGRTFLVVEENPVRIAAIADRLSLVESGRIKWSGTRAELEQSPEISETYFGMH